MKQLLKWRESGYIWKITGQPSRQIVPSFAARISACFAYMEASSDRSGNNYELAQAAAFHIRIFSSLAFSSCQTGLINVPKRAYAILVFHNLARVMF